MYEMTISYFIRTFSLVPGIGTKTLPIDSNLCNGTWKRSDDIFPSKVRYEGFFFPLSKLMDERRKQKPPDQKGGRKWYRLCAKSVAKSQQKKHGRLGALGMSIINYDE